MFYWFRQMSSDVAWFHRVQRFCLHVKGSVPISFYFGCVVKYVYVFNWYVMILDDYHDLIVFCSCSCRFQDFLTFFTFPWHVAGKQPWEAGRPPWEAGGPPWEAGRPPGKRGEHPVKRGDHPGKRGDHTKSNFWQNQAKQLKTCKRWSETYFGNTINQNYTQQVEMLNI